MAQTTPKTVTVTLAYEFADIARAALTSIVSLFIQYGSQIEKYTSAEWLQRSREIVELLRDAINTAIFAPAGVTLESAINGLGGVSKFANTQEAQNILALHGQAEVQPYLATDKGRLFVICGGQVVIGYNVLPKGSTRLHFYIVRDSSASNNWRADDPARGPKPGDVLRLVVSI